MMDEVKGVHSIDPFLLLSIKIVYIWRSIDEKKVNIWRIAPKSESKIIPSHPNFESLDFFHFVVNGNGKRSK